MDLPRKERNSMMEMCSLEDRRYSSPKLEPGVRTRNKAITQLLKPENEVEIDPWIRMAARLHFKREI